MLSIQISDIKDFMTHLLRNDTFHSFCLWKASIKTAATYHIDGRLNRDFFNSDELEQMDGQEYLPWAMAKPQIFFLIKGSKTPLSMKLILMLSRENVDHMLAKYNLPIGGEVINGLFFNIFYDGKELFCTTGISYASFTMDKRLEAVFEDNMKTCLKRCHIAFEDK